MVVNYGSWLVKPYFTNNPNGPCSHVNNNPQSPNHFMDAKDDEKLSSSKSLWIRLTGIYLIVLTVTICIIGTIVYLFVLPKVPLNTCNCSTNTKGIFARIEELERKLNLFEKSLPAFLEFEAQVYCLIICNIYIYIYIYIF